DINHSRVARSDVWAFTKLGAEVTLVAPPTLLPPSVEGWPVRVDHDLDAVLPTVDVVYLLRMQRERMLEALLPSLREYTACYGLTRRRVDLLRDKAIVMHPGPMNRGVELAADVADLPRSAVIDQGRRGAAARRAVLYDRHGSGAHLSRTAPGSSGDEIAADVADLRRSVVIDQVRNGVGGRRAVLYDLLGSGADLSRDLPGRDAR